MLTSTKTARLLVSRQDPDSRRFSRIGVLACRDDEYVFTYDDQATRPLPGLPLGQVHTSPDLFPIFSERVMHPLRPDRQVTLEMLGLRPEATPFEVLTVSGGRRTGDTYELTPLPEPGPIKLQFLVHGIRHLSPEERARIDLLKVGQSLTLLGEPTNEYNERALLVTDDGARLGYVPDPLLDYVYDVVASHHGLHVERINPPEAGLHMRLLVVLSGTYTG